MYLGRVDTTEDGLPHRWRRGRRLLVVRFEKLRVFGQLLAAHRCDVRGVRAVKSIESMPEKTVN